MKAPRTCLFCSTFQGCVWGGGFVYLYAYRSQKSKISLKLPLASASWVSAMFYNTIVTKTCCHTQQSDSYFSTGWHGNLRTSLDKLTPLVLFCTHESSLGQNPWFLCNILFHYSPVHSLLPFPTHCVVKQMQLDLVSFLFIQLAGYWQRPPNPHATLSL